ncbi:DUF6232 family protein [Haloglycomyces albus]|uniref:DUF6232 family protein n=1 Tax=Haloglycomyces albus TaxID=526067 RepID=UPI00046D6C01|nr:DUF6232 family protein [Haloglycomyces albus]
MPLNQSPVTVKIEDGSLKIYSELYPLGQIARVGKRRLEANDDRFSNAGGIGAVGLILSAIFYFCGNGGIAFLLLAATITLFVLVIVKTEVPPPVYGLVLSTSGGEHAAVWSTNQAEIDTLIQEISQAINDPDRPQMVTNVFNAVDRGDINQIYGDVSGGNIRMGR